MKKVILALLAASTLASAANAATVLYRNDFSLATDRMAQALASLGLTVTNATGDLSSFTLGNYDLVVYAAQNMPAPGSDIAALNSFIAGNGRVIFSTWTGSPPTMGASYNGTSNNASLTVGGPFGTGITSPVTLTNPGWGIFSLGMAAAGGTVAGTFGDGSAAIVIGNGGRTVINGFLTDTLPNATLFTNQITYVLSANAVPEPASWAMLIAGFGLVGAVARRRRAVAAA